MSLLIYWKETVLSIGIHSDYEIVKYFNSLYPDEYFYLMDGNKILWQDVGSLFPIERVKQIVKDRSV